MTDKPKPDSCEPDPHKTKETTYDTDIPEESDQLDLYRGKATIDQTIAFGDVDQTIVFSPTVDAFGTTSVDLPMSRSVMDDPNVTQTINPRELSPDDASIWQNVTKGSGAGNEPSQLPPAINRSLSETKLFLKGQVVADMHSDVKRQSDYRLVRLLGKGGMGNVYVARQGSLDRMVALKLIKPLEDHKIRQLKQKGTLGQVEQERRLQFISEAVITGDLDHPNIVPIHDIAVTGDNTLFYSMKRVSGTPWSKDIDKRSLENNLDILLKVCDAIGFAHTRGVVHRDIKPENIMIGEFGVVMVMDWGLALPKPGFDKIDSVHQSKGLGGSPAYMAPEMAIGPVDRIGPASDIYLLGATLFQIITSHAPHYATNVSECLKVVANNTIREVPEEQQGELLQIALKAMSTRTEDRYQDVQSFQTAIRDYLAHGKSIELANRASKDLDRADSTGDYQIYSRVIFAFEESITLWPENTRAIEGLAAARLRYAEAADRKGDFDLGLSLLSEKNEEHAELIEKLEAGKKERAARVTRLALLRKVAAAMLAFIIFGGAGALYAINQEKQNAISQKDRAELNEQKAKDEKANAEEQTKVAKAERARAESEKARAELNEQNEKKQKLIAEKNEADAIEAKARAEASEKAVVQANGALNDSLIKESAAKKLAEEKKVEADLARSKSEYEKYVSQIGLAKARIDQNEFNEANRILEDIRNNPENKETAWEWHWLSFQATRALSTYAVASPVRSLNLFGDKNSLTATPFATRMDDGSVQLLRLDEAGQINALSDAKVPEYSDASAIVVSPDRRSIVLGTNSGDLEVWDLELKNKTRSWNAHKTTINRLQFIDATTLVSASDDHSLRVWNIEDGMELASCWNLGPVKDFAVTETESGCTLLAAIAESTSGRATVWRIERTESRWRSELTGDFLEHQRPVLSVALSPTNDLAVSADIDGRLLVWRTTDVQVTDYSSRIEGAIRRLSGTKIPAGATQVPTKHIKLVDPSFTSIDPASDIAHQDRIRVVRFSPDGKTLLSGGDDYLIRLWDVNSNRLWKTLRGHGGWIFDAEFVGEMGSMVVSTSADSTIRSWQPSTYVNATVARNDAAQPSLPLHTEEILSVRLNPAGDSVVTASRDRTAVVSRINRDTMSLQRIAEFRDDDETLALKEGTQFVAQSMAFDADNALLYIANADAIVRVWDFNRGTELHRIESCGLNTSLALSDDGRFLLTRSSSPEAKSILWLLDPTGKRKPVQRFSLGGHAKELAITALAISGNGDKLFTADNGGIGILWDGRTGKQLGEKIESFRGYRINAAAFSKDGDELYVAADDQQLSRFDLRSRTVRSRLNHNGFVTHLSLSQGNQHAVTISEQTTSDASQMTVTLWDLSARTSQVLDRAVKQLKTIEGSNAKGASLGKKERITAAQFSEDGRSIAVGKQTKADGSGRVVIWSLNATSKASPTAAFETPVALGAPLACVPLPNNRMLTLNGEAAFQWDVNALAKDAAHLVSYRANASVYHANFSSDGKHIITASQSVKIWDIASQKAIAKIERPHDAPLTYAGFSPRNGDNRFVTSGTDGVVKLWSFDHQNNAVQWIQSWFENEQLPPIRRVCFSNDGSMLLAFGDRGTIRLIDLANQGAVSNRDFPESGDLSAAAFSSDKQYFIVGGDDSKARLWPVAQDPNVPRSEPILFEGHAEKIEDIRVLPSAAETVRVFTASRDKSVRVWDPRLGDPDQRAREILNLRQHAQGVTGVDTTTSGSLMVTSGREGEVVLWPTTLSPAE
jgi:WD40 repeat protein/serine/threonine protein kinase